MRKILRETCTLCGRLAWGVSIDVTDDGWLSVVLCRPCLLEAAASIEKRVGDTDRAVTPAGAPSATGRGAQ